MGSRIGIDVGGTFTDLLLFDDSSGELYLVKVLSSTADHALAIAAGLQDLLELAGLAPARIDSVLHGTSVPANTVLQEQGAKVGLLVTENFEQVLHLARSRTSGPLMGWMPMRKPDPLADLELTRGIEERINARGEAIKPLNEAQARTAIQELLRAGVEAVAISLLHSYANPEHEQRLRAIVEEFADPQASAPMPVYLSSQLLPRSREYERTLVTVMNAYAAPRMRSYLANLEKQLRDLQFSAQIEIMRSDGGSMSVQRAAQSPVHAILSGPAGGVAGAAFVASRAGYPDVLSFDMGGTSTDIALIRDAKPMLSGHIELGYYCVDTRAVEVQSVGAGGGSIAQVLPTGALRVGPQSAGAQPGPACYGQGGDKATLTDANIVLGRLPSALLGGAMTLDVQAAERAIGSVGQALCLDTRQAAQGIVDIANENIAGSLRMAAVQKGLEPGDFVLVAFGGAGPLHANAIAMLVDCYPVIVPPAAGVLSALGFLASDLRTERARAFIRHLDDIDPGQLADLLGKLGRDAKNWLSEEGADEHDQMVYYEIDARYFRQGNDITLSLDPQILLDTNGGQSDAIADIRARFGAAHERLYGFQSDAPLELVNLRATGIGRGAIKPELAQQAIGDSDAARALREQRAVYFDGVAISTDFYERSLLTAGNRITGPAVVLQKDSTTLIYPRHVGEVDGYLNILIYPEDRQSRGGRSAWH